MSDGDPAGGKGIITVTGATGRQGGALARRLVADGWTVRGLTRDANSGRARRLRAAGVEVVEGDMSDPTSLVSAFAGAHGVYSVQNPMTAGHGAEVVQGKNVANAAAEAGVRHVVYGSAGLGKPGTGVRQWDDKLEVEEHIRTLGLPLTVLRPMAFMELMTDRDFYPNVSTWHVMPKLMGWEREVVWVCVDDVAAIAAAAFARPEQFAGRQLAMAAEALSLADCKTLWTEVMGRAPRRFPLPVPIFERVADRDLTRMWRWLRDNPIDVDLHEARQLHPAMLTVREWLERRRAARS